MVYCFVLFGLVWWGDGLALEHRRSLVPGPGTEPVS